MNNIGIIDDNKDQRETLKLVLSAHLEGADSSLGVIDIFPFDTKTFEEYFSWIEQNNIVFLIFDEMMHNESEGKTGPVGYRGNQLVEIIRKRFKDIPIYVITAHKGDSDLQSKFSEFEDIIGRQEFIDDGVKWVSRFIRAAQRYLAENTDELEEFQTLAKQAATGKITEEDLIKLKAIQTKLQLPHETSMGERKDWLDEYEARIKEIEKLKNKIKTQIKGE